VSVAACAPPTVRERAPDLPPAAGEAPSDFPRRAYEQAASQGKPIYRIEPARSLLAITVGRSGSLARLGHDHVVASRGVQGFIAPAEGRADLYVPLAELSVDEPALRAEAGLDTQPSEAEIAATRSNMLDKVLEVQRFPFALIRVSGSPAASASADALVAVAITLHGTMRRFEVPVRITAERGEVRAAGSLDFDQSEFGIVPFSVMGGAIQVRDRLSLQFSLYASPVGAQNGSHPRSMR
jgi:hypothetical protein